MDSNEIKKRLSKLTPREREVLGLFCEELEYWQIAERLFITDGGVRAHMSNLAKKLELSSYTKGPRRELLLDEFCPVLKSGDIDFEIKEDIAEEEEDDRPLSREEEDLVKELDKALVTQEPIEFVAPPSPPGRGCARTLWMVVVGLLGGIAITLIVLFGLGIIQMPGAESQETTTAESLAQAAETENAGEPTEAVNTETVIPNPTDTSIPPAPTSTLPPSATPVPLPFEDDFNTGAKSEWDEIVGRWRMIEGAYAADRTGSWNVSLVGSESWTPSVIEVDAITDNWNWPVRVIVREYEGSFLILETNCCDTEFILVEGGEELTIGGVETGGLTGSIFWHTNHLRIEIDGTIYTVYVDGNQLLSIQDDTFTSGRVGLGLNYDARFDNFEVR